MVVNEDGCTFRVLGPVQVTAPERPVVFSRRQQLDLLAFLLLHIDHVVTVAQIVDAMWGEAVPRTATSQIKNMLSALRGALNDQGESLATVDRQPAGYRLHIVSGRLDLSVFNSLVAEARAAKSPEVVAALLRRALNLWQGPHALAGVRAAFVDAARTHLEEQRDAAREALFDAALECGNHMEIVAELTDAVADNPGRERLVGQLMLALYRGGRATDALAVYRRARQTLADEYGLEPGNSLRDLERLVLLSDPALDPPKAPANPVEIAAPPTEWTAGLPVPAQLPPDVRGFAGRGVELAQLNGLVCGVVDKPTSMVIGLLMGSAGIGKTALAVHWAHQISDRFVDGQLYANLRGFDPSGPAMSPAEAVRGFLDAFAVPPERIPAGLHAQAALYRSLVAGKRILVVLDNAVDAEQVRPLLPGTAGCLVVVTSRNRLSSLVATEGAYPVTLGVLTDVEARELLVGRLGAERVATESRAAEDIARQCARLPLALAMVAARAAIHPTFPLGTLAEELAREPSGDEVRAAFSWSYRRLSKPAARLFRLLGLHPGPEIAAAAAASVAGLPLSEVSPLLAELSNAHLVAEPAPGRIALHDLLHAYAAELARTGDPAGERHAAVRRMLDHYLHTAYAAALQLYPHRYPLSLVPAQPGVTIASVAGHEAALAWFNTEYPVLVAAIERAAEACTGAYAWQLASTVSTFLDRRGHWYDWAATQRTALAAAQRLSDRVGQAHAHGSLGLACTRLGDYDAADAHLRRAYTLLDELDDRIGQAYIHLRMSSLFERQGRHEDALEHAERALDLYRAAGHDTGHAQALNSIGWYHAQLGRYRDAIASCEQAVALHRELGDRQGVAHTLDSLGYAHHHLGRHSEAARYYRQALDVLREVGDRYYEAIALTHLGDAEQAAGRPSDARDAWQSALKILDELGHPDAEPLRARV